MSSISIPFKVVGVAAIIVAGLVAAAIASQPTQPVVWMVAYLVLIVGVVQYALGTGAATLPPHSPSAAAAWTQWLVLNLGHAGVVGGTLLGSSGVLVAGTILYDLAVIWLAWTVRHSARHQWRLAYCALAALMVVSSFVGLVLSNGGR